MDLNLLKQRAKEQALIYKERALAFKARFNLYQWGPRKKAGAAIGVAFLAIFGVMKMRGKHEKPYGDKVLDYIAQTGKTLRDCQKQTGKDKAACQCIKKDELNRIMMELQAFVESHPGLEKLYVEMGEGKEKKIRQVSNFVPASRFNWCPAPVAKAAPKPAVKPVPKPAPKMAVKKPAVKPKKKVAAVKPKTKAKPKKVAATKKKTSRKPATSTKSKTTKKAPAKKKKKVSDE